MQKKKIKKLPCWERKVHFDQKRYYRERLATVILLVHFSLQNKITIERPNFLEFSKTKYDTSNSQ